MSVQKERVAKGLCPRCGKEAAPYYLCARCRRADKFRRVLNSGAKHGAVTKKRSDEDRRTHLWSLADRDVDWSYNEAREDDRRCLPRLRNVPIDVEAELIEILREEGKSMREDEIMAAWGKLRLRNGKGSIARQLAYLIEAEQKRRARAAARAPDPLPPIR